MAKKSPGKKSDGKRAPSAKSAAKKTVTTLVHDEASRKNIPTAEYQSVVPEEQQSPIRVAYKRRNRDLDPQLVWRGKDWSDLVVHAPPLYILEKVHPKVLVDDLLRRSRDQQQAADPQATFFPTSSPALTGCPTPTPRPSSTSTMATGRIA